MATTRPTEDDLRVIIQTLAISGSIGQDDGSALLREIDALRADNQDLRAVIDLLISMVESRESYSERSRQAFRDALDIARDALAAEHRPEAGEGADA